MIHFDCGHIYKWNCETRWSDGDQMRTALIVSGGLDTCVTCGFFIYSGCVSRPVAVHQLHGHTVWWEGPLVKRLLPGGKQAKKERSIDSWLEPLNSGSAVFNPTEVKTVFTHVCCVGSFHFRGLKFKMTVGNLVLDDLSRVSLLTGSRWEVRGQILLLSSVEENTVLVPRR